MRVRQRQEAADDRPVLSPRELTLLQVAVTQILHRDLPTSQETAFLAHHGGNAVLELLEWSQDWHHHDRGENRVRVGNSLADAFLHERRARRLDSDLGLALEVEASSWCAELDIDEEHVPRVLEQI